MSSGSRLPNSLVLGVGLGAGQAFSCFSHYRCDASASAPMQSLADLSCKGLDQGFLDGRPVGLKADPHRVAPGVVDQGACALPI